MQLSNRLVPLSSPAAYITLKQARDIVLEHLFDTRLHAGPTERTSVGKDEIEDEEFKWLIALWRPVQCSEHEIRQALLQSEIAAILPIPTTRLGYSVPALVWGQRQPFMHPRPFCGPLRAATNSRYGAYSAIVPMIDKKAFLAWLSRKLGWRVVSISSLRRGPNNNRTPGLIGRPPKYDWGAFHVEALRILRERGLPSEDSARARWQRLRDFEQCMLDWCARTWGADLSRSTISEALSRARARYEDECQA